MTSEERQKLINKLSVQLVQAKHNRLGVVLSHKVAEAVLSDLRELQQLITPSKAPLGQ